MLGARFATVQIPQLKGKAYILPDFDNAFEFLARCWGKGFIGSYYAFDGERYGVRVWRGAA